MGDEGEVMISAADPLPTTNAYAFLYFFHFILRPVQSCQSIDQVRRAPHTPSSWNHAWPNGVPENSEPFHWRRDSDNKMFRSDGCVCVCVLRVVCGFQNKFQKNTKQNLCLPFGDSNHLTFTHMYMHFIDINWSFLNQYLMTMFTPNTPRI
jgi:hypothetical protein